MRSKTSIYASESEQTTQAMRILLRTDDFLTMVLNYLNNDKDAMYDSFLTSGEIIQNIFQYSTRSSSTKSLAESFIEAVIGKMNAKEIHQFEKECSEDSAADENLMIMTVLKMCPSLLSSREYRYWLLRIKIDRNSESHMMRKMVELSSGSQQYNRA